MMSVVQRFTLLLQIFFFFLRVTGLRSVCVRQRRWLCEAGIYGSASIPCLGEDGSMSSFLASSLAVCGMRGGVRSAV